MGALRDYDYALNALGDPTRRSIFEKLEKGPLSVMRIADGLPVTRPAVSQHLKVLREAKLIFMEQQGTRSIYKVNTQGLLSIRRYLDRFWDESLQNLKRVAEETEKQKSKKRWSR